MLPVRAALAALALTGCADLLGVAPRTLSEGGAGGGGAGGGGAGGAEGPCFLTCDGACVDPFTSDAHCGRCGDACAAGERCWSGVCDRRLRSGPASYTYFVRTDAGPYVWGGAVFGNAGTGAAVDEVGLGPASLVPSDAVFAAPANRATCALLASGGVSCFGANTTAQLGLGTLGGPDSVPESAGCCSYTAPVSPSLPSGELLDLAAGGFWATEDFFCALLAGDAPGGGEDAGGDVYCWGGAQTTIPKKLDHVVQVVAGRSYACALRTDGTVWCWGRTEDAVTLVPTLPPAQVPGLPRIRRLGGGAVSVYAIDEDGALWAWGKAENGLLGPGTDTSTWYYPPVAFQWAFPAALVDVTGTEVSACALLEDGEVHCWGALGFLGDGAPQGGLDATPRAAGVSDVVEIATFAGVTLARDTAGDVYQWGASPAFVLNVAAPP